MKNKLFLAACLMVNFAAVATDADIKTSEKGFAWTFVQTNAAESSDKEALVLKVQELIKEGKLDKIAEFVKSLSSDKAQQAVMVAALLKEIESKKVAS